jgi:hypothetical protein
MGSGGAILQTEASTMIIADEAVYNKRSGGPIR